MCLSIMLILVLCVTAMRPVVVTASDSTDTQMFIDAARSFAEQAEAARGHHLTKDPVMTIMSKQVQAGKMEVVMEIDEMSVLNSGPRDAEPVLAGKLQYLQDHGAALSVTAKKAVEDDIADWRSTIESAMTVPTESTDMIKIVADVDLAGTVDTNTLQVYVDDGIVGSHYTSAAQSLKDMRSAWATVAEAYDSSASLVADVSAKSSIAPAVVSSSYSPTLAYQYADVWAKETTSLCSDGTRENTANWNNVQYPLYGQQVQCNDCADFVSQCLHAGNIPMTSAWNYSGASPTLDWCKVGSLQYYLLHNGYITYNVPRLSCMCGDPFFFEDEDQYGQPNGVLSHAVFMVYDDGKDTYYDAHTNDRHRLHWDGTLGGYVYHYAHVIY
jgi:hypothetical protein